MHISDDKYKDEFMISIKSLLSSKGSGTDEGEQHKDLKMDSTVIVNNIGLEITLTRLKVQDLQGERHCYKVDSKWNGKTNIDFQDTTITFSMKFFNKSLIHTSNTTATYTDDDVGEDNFIIKG